ncbi:M10 family metallopeptidase C-terminal domain-containing protein [Duganella guangzhouensis]|nr:M10 family metallopeptidase C-terminal domain-containing protein [Duganella guangzhouensis]
MSSPTTGNTVTKVAATGNVVDDSLLEGYKWGGKLGTPLTITYSFPYAGGASATFSSNYSSLDEPDATQHYGLNAVQQNAFRAALQTWENVANITAVQVADTATSVGDIRIGWTSASDTTSDGSNAWGWGYYPSATYAKGGDIWISTTSSAATDTDWSAGSYNFNALIHELGHTLGLQHPFEGTVTLPAAYDNRQYSIMAYDNAPNSLFVDVTDNGVTHSWRSYYVVPDTPMVYDIAVMQYLYGANMSYKTGDDVYTFDPTKPFFHTIWDAGGNDTISVANFTTDNTIDLRPGQYSNIDIPSDTGAGYNWTKAPPTPTYGANTLNLGIAFGAIIENAIGGSGNDILIGNSVANHLQGNGGINRLDGLDGIDTAVYSGKFNDYFISTTSDGEYTVSLRSSAQVDALVNMERLSFADTTLALNVNSLAEDPLIAQYTALAQKFYVAYFGRPADANGLANMVAQFKAAGAPTTTDGFVAAYATNATVKALIDSFGNSDESAALYSGSNKDFISAIYAHLLGRAPDAEGLAFWAGALDDGNLVRGMAALNIAAGAETNTSAQGKIDATLIANRVTVAENFTASLDTAAEIASYAGAKAAEAARTLLDAVNQDTSIIGYESSVLSTVAHLSAVTAEAGALPVQLVGVHVGSDTVLT